MALCALAQNLFDAGIAVSAPSDLSMVIPWLESNAQIPYAYVNTLGPLTCIASNVARDL